MAQPWERNWGASGGHVGTLVSDPYKARSADREDQQLNITEANLALAKEREARESQGQTTGSLPVGYRWTDASHTKQEIIPGGPADTGGDSATGGQSEQATVKALVDGRMAFPTGAALRSPYWQNMLAKVAQLDPSFDAVNYNARAATRRDFTSGVAARNITALNTALGHLGSLWSAANDLHNRSFTPWNAAANATESTFGDASKATFETSRDALADELEKAFNGSGGTLAGIQAWKNNLTSSSSPDQFKKVTGNW